MIDLFFKNLWRWKLGLDEKDINCRIPDIENLRESEWSPKFEKYMRNRLIIGAIRYGLLNSNGKNKYDRIGSIEQRLDIYKKTKNKELLVDIANLCLLEFEENEDGSFNAIDDKNHVLKIE